MDSRQWLSHLEQFGIKLGLTTISAIVDELGRPDRRYSVVHIAGTNGKGSVAAMVARALSSAGHRTGLYTSPHLIRLEERFRVDGRSVASPHLDQALDDVRDAVARLQARGALDVEPTYFEATTAAAFLLFARAEVRVAVVEVGLGGRFDATNVVSPIVTAITSIDFDHEAQLGSTLAAIAAEKAGIIKSGVPVVIGNMAPESLAVIETVARERGAPIAYPTSVRRLGDDGGHERVSMALETGSIGPLRLSLAGEHQVANAAVAARLLEIVVAGGLAVGASHIAAGLSTARWPARIETVVTPRGRAIVDGAHNPAGAAALASYLQQRHPARLPIVFGAMHDKSLAAMIAALLPCASPFVFTRAPGRRAAQPDELASIARELGATGFEISDDLEGALVGAWRHGPEVVVAGSLYLAGAALSLLGVPVE